MRQVSIIIPTYNEEENIGKLIDQIKASMFKFDYEIIIIDDASTDRTQEIALGKKTTVIDRVNEKNLFTAILLGIEKANSHWIVTMDADFSHPPEKIPELLSYLCEYDMVSGSRYVRGGQMLRQRWITRNASKVVNWMLRYILDMKYKDITGGFHAMWKNKFDRLNFKHKCEFGEFDLEWFYRAKQLGYKIKEVPFKYKYRTHGKSKSKEMYYVWLYLIRALQLRFGK